MWEVNPLVPAPALLHLKRVLFLNSCTRVFSKGTEQYKSSTFVLVSHASYYLCKLVEKFPRGESVQFCNARWSSPSWSCHTASFPWIETVALPVASQKPNLITFVNQCPGALIGAGYNYETHTFIWNTEWSTKVTRSSHLRTLSK